MTLPAWGADDAPSEQVVVEADTQHGVRETETSAALTVIPLDGSLPISGEVADALETAAGVRIQRLGGLGGWSTVSIRGSSSRQVSVYLDGIPLNPDGATALNLSELPTTAFERIEVYRGNPPPQFGAAPMGGVVNLVTPMQPEAMGFSATAGDHSTQRVGAFGATTVEAKSMGIDAWTSVEALSTEGDFSFFQDRSTVFNRFDDAFDVRQNNDKSQLNFLGRIRGRADLGTISLTQGLLQRDEGIPGPGAAQSIGSRLETERSFTALSGDTAGPWGRTQLSGWRIQTDEVWDDRDGEVGVGREWEERNTRMLGAQSTTDVVLLPSLVGTIAASARHDRYEQKDLLTETEESPITRTTWSASPGVRAQLWKERVQADGTLFVQGLHNEVFGDVPFADVLGALSRSETQLVTAKPRAGVLVRLAPNTVAKASWGHYLRPPDFTELFGNRGSVVGNPSLLPESSQSTDLGLRTVLPWNRLKVVADAAVFRAKTDNKIVFVQNSQQTVRPINIKGSLVHGVEAALTVDLFDVLNSRTSFSRTWSEDLSSAEAYKGNQLPGVPTMEVWQQTALHWNETAAIGHTFSFTDGEHWDRANWNRAAPRQLHSAFARISPFSSGPQFEVEARNLTNQMVQRVARDPLNPRDDTMILKSIDDFNGYPLPGRTWLVSLRWDAQTKGPS